MANAVEEFKYCSFCQLSHRKKNHVYSKKHQEVIKHILLKYGKKVKEAKKHLKCTQVASLTWEHHAKFWCYFCAAEVERHAHLDEATVKWEEHRKAVHKFWFENRIDVKKKDRFFLTEEKFNAFKLEAVKAIRCYLAKEKEKLKKMAAQIERQAKQREYLVNFQHQLQAMSQGTKPTKRLVSSSVTKGPDGSTRGMKTVGAMGEGLTCITIKETDADNVYSGATPPWMQTDSDHEDETSSIIGPTITDWQRHLNLEEKRKLPAGRVGAEFDHQQGTLDSWLPTFGRVWNNSRRLHSKEQFIRMQGKRPHFTSMQGSDSLSSSLPYKNRASIAAPEERRKRMPPTATVTMTTANNCGYASGQDPMLWLDSRERTPPQEYGIHDGAKSHHPQTNANTLKSDSNSYSLPAHGQMAGGYSKGYKRKFDSYCHSYEDMQPQAMTGVELLRNNGIKISKSLLSNSK